MTSNAVQQTQPRVLLVDDDPDHLALYERWLTLAGYRVDTAAGGGEALASLERAICDTSYLVPSFVFEYMNQADPDELLRLSKIYANKALARRIEKLVDARVG